MGMKTVDRHGEGGPVPYISVPEIFEESVHS